MTNMNLIERATGMVVEFFELEGTAVDTESIRKRVTEWYNHTDITEPEMLASAAWIGEYNPKIKYQSIEEAKTVLYPEEPLEVQNYHIGEIEEALRDADWQ